MSVYKRGRLYWVKFQFKGVTVRQPAKTTSLSKARAFERALREEAARLYRGGKPRHTVLEAIDRFQDEFLPTKKPSSAKRYNVSLVSILAHFGDIHLDQISKGTISDYIAELRKTGMTGSGVRRNLACLSKMCSEAVRWDWLDDNPLLSYDKRSIPENPERTRFLNDREYPRLLQFAPIRLKPIIIVLVETGMRIGEVCAMSWDDIDHDSREIHIPVTKTSSPRTIPLCDAAWAQIRAQPRHFKSPLVFYRSGGIAYKVADISSRIAKAAKRARIENFKPHDLRHTYASWFVQRGGRIERLQKLLGHKHINMTMKYAHLRTEELREEVDRVGTKVGTEPRD